MDVHHSDDEKKGKFFIQENGPIIAQMSYVWTGSDQIIIDHTEVDEKLKGQGAGKRLLLVLVEFARHNGLRVIPLCPFAKSVFEKTPEIQDVLRR